MTETSGNNLLPRLLIASLVLAAFSQLAQFGWIQGKGRVGQWLMASAWADGDGERAALPWPGARTRPAARLFVPELQLDRLVVEGVATANLAWGPGIETGPNGHVLIAGHRDTHFRFLGDLERGHRLALEHPPGIVKHWRVRESRVVDSRTTRLDMDAPGPLLTLVTCWPIDATEAGGPLRLVVSAVPTGGDNS